MKLSSATKWAIGFVMGAIIMVIVGVANDKSTQIWIGVIGGGVSFAVTLYLWDIDQKEYEKEQTKKTKIFDKNLVDLNTNKTSFFKLAKYYEDNHILSKINTHQRHGSRPWYWTLRYFSQKNCN